MSMEVKLKPTESLISLLSIGEVLKLKSIKVGIREEDLDNLKIKLYYDFTDSKSGVTVKEYKLTVLFNMVNNKPNFEFFGLDALTSVMDNPSAFVVPFTRRWDEIIYPIKHMAQDSLKGYLKSVELEKENRKD